MPTIAYPGTFDPVTHGHEEIIRRAAKIFDQVIVAVARGAHKDPLFTLDERVAMLQDATSSYAQVEVAPVNGLLADFVAQRNIAVVLRGMRSVADFEFEMQLADVNRRLSKGVETLFMAPDTDHIYVFSKIVREVAMFGGDISHYVNASVAEKLKTKLAERPATSP